MPHARLVARVVLVLLVLSLAPGLAQEPPTPFQERRGTTTVHPEVTPLGPPPPATPLPSGSPPPQVGTRTTVACSPANYAQYHNTDQGFPETFCPYTYLPYRVRLPDNPQMINQDQTTILQQQYVGGCCGEPGSNPVAVPSISNILTMGVPPPPPGPARDGYGSSNMAVYTSTPSDPLVTLYCRDGNVSYGCGDYSGHSVCNVAGCQAPFDGLQVHIPAYAHAPGEYAPFQDTIMEVIQPDGHSFTILNCFAKDWTWKNGDTIGGTPGPCPGLGGMAYGSVVTEPGINPGIINAGNNPGTLRVRWHEIVNQDIRHPLLAYGGCFTGAVYPAIYQTLGCTRPPGLPSGVHFYLSLTRAQIDALPTTTVAAHMRPFLYAAHEHGVFAMDTGNGDKWLTVPQIEECMPYVMATQAAGTDTKCTHWYDWFVAHGGGLSGDGALKMGPPNTFDWRPLQPYLFVLDNCYVRGTCPDSVPEGQCTCGQPGCPACPCTCGQPGCPPCSGPPPPLALWPFNEGAGTVAHTSTAPDKPLSLTTPGPFWGGGHTGTSLECNDTGSASLGTVFPGTTYSWAFWFQPVTAPSTSAIQQPLNAGGMAGDTWGFSWGHVSPAFRQTAHHRRSDGTWVGATLPGTLTLNTWVHLAGTYDGTTLRLYLNGLEAATTPATSAATPTGNFSVCRPAPNPALGKAPPPDEPALRAVTDQGLWGVATPIADNAHPNLVWNQAEVDQLRTMLLTNHSPAWLWDRYVSTFQGRTAINWTTSDVYGYEPWTTNTRAAFTYMLEPTSAKADAVKSAVMSLLTAYPNGSVPSWFQTPWAMSGFPAAWLFDLLQAYHPEKLSAAERQQLKTWYRQAAMSPGLMEPPHKVDDTFFGYPITKEGKTVGEYNNSASISMFHALSMAAVSGDQATVDFWFDSGWPHDRVAYDGTNEPAAGTNRYDLAMHIYAIYPSGANSDTYSRELFGIDPALPLTTWKTNCYACDADPTGNTKGDGGDYSLYQGNPVALAAVMGKHLGMTSIFQGTPGQALLNFYLLNWHSRLHTDYRSTSASGHPDISTYPSNYVSMRHFSDNPELQAAQSSWVDTDSNGSKFIDWPLWPYLGYPFGVAGEPPITVSNPYGRMDDLTIWDVALTPAQVQGVYQGQQPVAAQARRRHATSIGLQ